MSAFARSILSVILFGALAGVVAAKQCLDLPDYRTCVGISSDRSYSTVVSACTVVIATTDERSICRTLAFDMRGRAHSARGNFAAALADFDKVIELKPGDGVVYAHRGLTYFKMGKYDLAIRDFDEAIRRHACFCYGARGNANFRKGDYERAVRDYNLALAQYSGDKALVLFGRGAAKNHLGDVTGGKADMDAAVTLQPNVASILAQDGIAP